MSGGIQTPRRWSPRRLRRLLVGLLALSIAIVFPLLTRVWWEGRAELERASEAEVEGRVDDEIVALGRAARWRLPLVEHDDHALDRLSALALEHEARGDEGLEVAVAAHREVRRAILGTRAWGIHERSRLEQANRRIAALMARQIIASGDTSLSAAGHEEAQLALLSRDLVPSPVRANLSALVFMLWVAAGVGFVLKAIDPRGRLRPRAARRWGVLMFVALVAWMVLMRWS